ncbi:MFS transporter [Actinokineospora sp. NBRC 105648]|uniref:MFS transporter n=1 Tax=Actinokineospora sp. NBRC 105648 TaxID=3032206 RepID=UPI00255582C4|nr:MFS transporter [Actinokineospora sp. NBRC 105648]
MLGPYRQLLTVPRLPGLLIWSLLGRLHLAGTALATTFLIAGWTGSYVAAGVVSGAYTVGIAAGGPLRGRAADRGDPARLLLVAGVLYAAGMTLLAFAPLIFPARLWVLAVVIGFATGTVQPPVTQISRAAWPRLAEGAARQSLYAVEATLQELLFVVGPVLTAVVVATVSPRAGVLMSAGLALAGALGFARALHHIGLRTPVERTHGNGPVLRAPGMPAAVLMSLCVVAPLTTLDMTIVAWARDAGAPALSGVLVAVWAITSAVGGLVMGAREAAPRLGLRALVMALGYVALVPVLPPVIDGSALVIGLVLGLGGFAIAPALSAINGRIGELAPPGRAAEAFGWVLTASLFGSALMLPVAGWLLDHIGPAAAAGSASVVALIAAALALAVPDPTGRRVPA